MTPTGRKPSQAERRQRLVDIGTVLHGELFGSKLARGMGVSQQLISFIVKGERDVTDDIETALLHYAVATLEARKAMMIKAIKHIGSLTYELGDLSVWTKTGGTVPDATTLEPEPELEPNDDPAPGMTP